jgi:flavin reductase
MRRLASGVSIITTMQDGKPHGLAATSVTSVSADPVPILLVCVSKTASCHDQILQSGHFCVNVLSEEDAETARLFSSADERSRRFQAREWSVMSTGSPALTEALANFDCRLQRTLEIQSHSVLFGEVVDVRLRGGDIHPLIYVEGRFAGLGANAPHAGA